MRVLCVDVPEDALNAEEYQYLQKYTEANLDIEQVWRLMDAEWDRCGAGYGEDKIDAIRKFYESPVWLLNGIFSECDSESIRHRDLIADWVVAQKPNLVADFGGGYGSLARKIAQRCPDAKVVIVEPHPTELAKRLILDCENLCFDSELPQNADVVIAQDVLEHLPDPLAVFYKLLGATREGGFLITANCFHPVIKCHLPSTFHFRYTFRFIVPYMGCKYVGIVPSVGHAQIFRKNNLENVNQKKIKILEYTSRAIFPFFEAGVFVLKPLWRFVRKRFSA